MIRIGKTIKELDEIAKVFLEEIEKNLNPKGKIEDKSGELNNGSEKDLYENLKRDFDSLITSHPKELETLSTQLSKDYERVLTDRIDQLVNPDKKQKSQARLQLRNELLSVFDYKKFTQFNDAKWAYDHAKRLGLNVCPYCNAQYTFTIKTTSAKTRPQFDHFFKKEKYPFLALSFYNLIPSCSSCNSNLKGRKDFKASTHIHPFIEGVEDVLKFRTEIDNVDDLLNNKEIKIQLAELKSDKLKVKLKRANKNAKIFLIEKQHQFHEKYVREIIAKSYVYTDSRINTLANDEVISQLFTSKDEIKEMLYGNILREDKLHERPLAKLTYNIAEELGIV